MRQERAILEEVYERQFRELSDLRSYICSIVPFRRFKAIVEPGCGSGLLAAELSTITSASYSGIDRDEYMLSAARSRTHGVKRIRFLCADALHGLPSADAVVSSFFLAGLADPLGFLRGVSQSLPEGGFYVSFGEYNYAGLSEDPSLGLADMLKESLGKEGFSIEFGANADSVFEEAEFTRVESGSVRGEMQKPDPDFLNLQLGSEHEGLDSMLSWEITWGIYRKF